jgi:hypothetical protein
MSFAAGSLFVAAIALPADPVAPAPLVSKIGKASLTVTGFVQNISPKDIAQNAGCPEHTSCTTIIRSCNTRADTIANNNGEAVCQLHLIETY